MHDLLWAPQFCNDYSLILEFLPRVLAKEKWYTHIDWYPETPLKKSFSALIKLVRFQEYGYFILITSLLGAVTAGGILSDRLLAILLANGLVVGFAHMVNDIEDAAEDVFSLKNSLRNPISSGLILPKTARLTAAIVGLIAVALFALMGRWPVSYTHLDVYKRQASACSATSATNFILSDTPILSTICREVNADFVKPLYSLQMD